MHNIASWLHAHDTDLDLATVWLLSAGLAVLALVKLRSWWVLRTTDDRTDVGRELKRQKATESFVFFALALLYGLTLDAYYQHEHFGFWFRFGLRVVLIAAIVAAVIFGLRFIAALTATVKASHDPADEPRATGLP